MRRFISSGFGSCSSAAQGTRAFRCLVRCLVRCAALVALAGLFPLTAAGAAPEAAQLLERASKGSAYAAKAIKESGLDVQSAELLPIGSALKKSVRGIGDVERHLGEKSSELPSRIAALGRATEELRIVLQRGVYRNPSVERGVGELSSAVGVLSQSFAAASLQHAPSRALDERGVHALREVRQSVEETFRVVTALSKKAEDFHDAAMVSITAELLDRLRPVRAGQESVDGLSAALAGIDRYLALCAASAYFLDSSWRDDWKPLVAQSHALLQVADEAREILPAVLPAQLSAATVPATAADSAITGNRAEEITLARSEVLVYDEFVERFRILDDENAISVATRADGTVRVLEREERSEAEDKSADEKTVTDSSQVADSSKGAGVSKGNGPRKKGAKHAAEEHQEDEDADSAGDES